MRNSAGLVGRPGEERRRASSAVQGSARWEVRGMVAFLLLIIAAFVLGIIDATVAKLGYLLIIAIVLFAADVVVGVWRWSRQRGRRAECAAG
ncbi:hypothetical protein [Streptomyces sp. NPDC048142]|uniref:hypothetical protein n=1 Tax=Streptomyces sp. NPDC048142 TaxID=3365501 RepID=UPI00371264BF